jgi:leucine dehydrogenase
MSLTTTQTAASIGVLASMEEHDHEEVLFCHDRATGLRAIIAVHDTTLGPSLGGTRMWVYADERDALRDVLRLSRGMTYKSALAGLDPAVGKLSSSAMPASRRTRPCSAGSDASSTA